MGGPMNPPGPSTSAPVTGATPLLDSDGLRAADRYACDEAGIPSLVLMERAGAAAAELILRRYPHTGTVTLLVGPGNNGGDGMVVARRLAEAAAAGGGWSLRVITRDGEPPATPDAATMSAAAGRVWLSAFDPYVPAFAGDLIIDAMLGTGQDGDLREPIRGMCRWANAQGVPIVALDVPTGVAADTGRADPDAIHADVTVTFHADTVGLRVHPGRAHAGEVVVAPIGIPADAPVAPAAWGIDARAAAAIPRKGEGGDKYASGAVLVVAGARGMSGAARLATTAVLRAGAGLCQAMVPGPVADLVAAGAPEVMVAALPSGAPHLTPGDVDAVIAASPRFSALALGPGLGRDPATGDAVRDLVARCPLPAVIDADALWHLVGHAGVTAERAAPTVITPHTGEAARLLETAREHVDAARLEAAADLAARFGATVVLKGPGTIVCDGVGAPLVCLPGGPELATAGSGDVLTGVVAAFLAKGVPALTAAAAAVAVHAEAGVLAGRGDGTLAGDIAAALPDALRAGRTA